MKGEDLKGMIMEMVHKLVEDLVDTYTDPKLPFSEWDWEGLKEAFKQQFFFPLELEVIPKVKREDLVEMLFSQTREYYEEKEKHVGPELMREVEKFLLLHTLDNHWKEHLLNLDHLKEGIGLWGYAQKDPLVQYKKEGYQMFLEMLDRFREDVVRKLFAVQITRGEEVPSLSSSRRFSFELVRGPLPFQEVPQGPPSPQVQGPIRRKTPKVGRNDPCPCGSGKKYKHCCGK
jgi:preprotein translocase subunit SecA